MAWKNSSNSASYLCNAEFFPWPFQTDVVHRKTAKKVVWQVQCFGSMLRESWEMPKKIEMTNGGVVLVM